MIPFFAKYRYLILAGICIISFYFGWKTNDNWIKAKQYNQTVEIIKDTQKEKIKNRESELQLEQKLEELELQNRKLNEKLDELPNDNNCIITPDELRIWNDSKGKP